MALTWPTLTEGQWNLLSANKTLISVYRLKSQFEYHITSVLTGLPAPAADLKNKSKIIFSESNNIKLHSESASDFYIWIENADTANNETSANCILLDDAPELRNIIDPVSGKSIMIKANLNSGSNEVLVNLEGHKCLENSTSINLLAGGIFTGSGWQSTIDYGVISVDVIADQDSAVDGLIIQWSHDGIEIDNTDEFSILANKPKTFTFGPANEFIRIKYINGAVNQGNFSLQTILRKVYVKPSSHRIKDSVVGDDDAELIKSVITGEDETGNFVNIRASQGETGYNLKVSLDQIEDTTNSVKTMVYSHAELHAGKHYFYKKTHALAKAGVLNLLIVAPNTTQWPHMTIGIDAVSSQVLVQLFRGTTVSANGTLKDSFNRNQNFPDDNTTEIYEAPTITTTGIEMTSQTLGAGKGSAGGGDRDTEEIIKKQNTNYLLRITEANLAVTDVNIKIDWYEHTSLV